MTVNIELMLACDLKSDTPDQVVETLKYLTRKEDYEFNNPPQHPFFESNIPVYLNIKLGGTFFNMIPNRIVDQF